MRALIVVDDVFGALFIYGGLGVMLYLYGLRAMMFDCEGV